MQEEDSNATNTTKASLEGFISLLVGVLVVINTLYFTTRSFSEPGGVIYGARIWFRSYTSPPSGHRSDDQNRTYPVDDICDLHDPNEDALPAVRTEFGTRATIVYGWPSSGGVWVHEDCYGLELDFLGLSRFEQSATERFSKEEDAFCKRLEWIGARYYESEYVYNSRDYLRQESQLWVAWPGSVPEGGVWMLWTRDSRGAELGVSRIRNALTMEERCQAIKLLGGKFYQKWDDVVVAFVGLSKAQKL